LPGLWFRPSLRACRLPGAALALLFMGEASKVAVTWAAGMTG
jgi:hypothetical protein